MCTQRFSHHLNNTLYSWFFTKHNVTVMSYGLELKDSSDRVVFQCHKNGVNWSDPLVLKQLWVPLVVPTEIRIIIEKYCKLLVFS